MSEVMPYNFHSYHVAQDRLAAGLPLNGPVRPVAPEQVKQWANVQGSDGSLIHTNDGLLMVSECGEYASDTGFHLIQITQHEAQQARVKHELKLVGYMA
jgi:hypothetical protein